MRKLLTICLIAAMALTGNAQIKGPTKEQTITFIKDYFAEHQFIGRKTSSQSKTSCRNIKADFNDCKVTIYWDDTDTYFNMTPDNLNKTYVNKYEVVIDFKNIESVEIRPSGDDDGNGQYQAHLTLKAAPNTTFSIRTIDYHNSDTGFENVKEVNIPVNSYSCSSCDHWEYSKKIQQAFNHLRKLCGAPEPISFE